MTRSCAITAKSSLRGHQVSHSNRKTLRRFHVNLQPVTLHSDLLNQDFSLRIAVSTLRSIDKNGGLDSYLLGTPNRKLNSEAIRIKRRLRKAQESKKAA